MAVSVTRSHWQATSPFIVGARRTVMDLLDVLSKDVVQRKQLSMLITIIEWCQVRPCVCVCVRVCVCVCVCACVWRSTPPARAFDARCTAWAPITYSVDSNPRASLIGQGSRIRLYIVGQKAVANWSNRPPLRAPRGIEVTMRSMRRGGYRACGGVTVGTHVASQVLSTGLRVWVAGVLPTGAGVKRAVGGSNRAARSLAWSSAWRDG